MISRMNKWNKAGHVVVLELSTHQKNSSDKGIDANTVLVKYFQFDFHSQKNMGGKWVKLTSFSI